MSYKILVKHYYKEPTPHVQEIIDNGEYYMRYALFMALLDSHLDFEIVPFKEQIK